MCKSQTVVKNLIKIYSNQDGHNPNITVLGFMGGAGLAVFYTFLFLTKTQLPESRNYLPVFPANYKIVEKSRKLNPKGHPES